MNIGKMFGQTCPHKFYFCCNSQQLQVLLFDIFFWMVVSQLFHSHGCYQVLNIPRTCPLYGQEVIPLINNLFSYFSLAKSACLVNSFLFRITVPIVLLLHVCRQSNHLSMQTVWALFLFADTVYQCCRMHCYVLLPVGCVPAYISTLYTQPLCLSHSWKVFILYLCTFLFMFFRSVHILKC